MPRITKMEVIIGPTSKPPWNLEGRGPLSKAEGDYDYRCGTCNYLLFAQQYDGEIKSGYTVQCPVCGSTLRA
jgi:hypothetical protein